MQHVVTPAVRLVHARAGDEIVIRLPEQVGGGYEWRIAGDVPAGLEQFVAASPVSDEAVGSARASQLGLRLTRPGVYQVRLVHGRPWGDHPHIESRDLDVIVEPAPH